ncbi:MAG: EAL domain-containing protein, partial [Thermaurantiacus tibetensis]
HLDALRAAGVRIALDDFGTGHASLVHLGTLPVDGLKVDRSFTAAIGRDRRGELLTRTILGLARGLDLACVVEGVETEAQRRFLEAHGCTHIQGWLTGRPMPLDAARAVVAATSPGRPAAQAVRRRTYTAGARSG